MDSEFNPSNLSTDDLKRGLAEREGQRKNLLAAFRELAGTDDRSLTARYVGGGKWEELYRLNSEIESIKLELWRRGELPEISKDSNEGAKGAELESTVSLPDSRTAQDRKPAKPMNREMAVRKKVYQLTDREKAILAVIKRGSKGRQYCRELDGAGIAPSRTGIWQGAPRSYLSAYDSGQPWRHRIEVEKSRIKAKLSKVSAESATRANHTV